jgi:hypothetical protein
MGGFEDRPLDIQKPLVVALIIMVRGFGNGALAIEDMPARLVYHGKTINAGSCCPHSMMLYVLKLFRAV